MAGGNELVAGTKCYVPDEQLVWLPAQIVREEKSNDPSKPEKIVVLKVFPADTVAHSDDDGDGGSPPSSSKVYQERVMDFNDKNVKAMMKSLQLESLPYQNENLGEFGIEDMIALNYLHEAAILYNVKKRFLKRLPYTYTGDICIAVNPYQWLPELYAEDIHTQYLTKNRDELPPHVYATSVASYNDMKRNAMNQSILVSGESGAGKTETTKILMNHLASIAGGLNDTTIKKIIEVNPLLESFGNAKTVRNDNSSRFGKFTQLQFDKAGILVGARCRTYLLEKTRVIHHESPERNYHIFYQILESTSAPKWYLDNSKSYTYTGDNTAMKIEGISDEAHFERTRTALGLIGLSYEEQEVLFEVLAGILHLGEIKINKKNGNDEEAVIAPNDPAAASTTALFGISVEDLETALCSRKIAVSGEILKKHLRKEQAEECRDALAKATYSNIFDWLVSVINVSLENDKKMCNHVGILDIFGFEHFKHNSFEQFCINYANEKLQQKFTQDVFKTVQLEYEAEGIIWSHIDFADNQDVISIIEDRLGIISLLNDEVMRPKGNDESLVSKLTSIHKEDKHVIEFPRTSRTQFTIKHYAAAVTYESLGFLEKHKDALLPDLSDLMRSSSKSFLSDIFAAKGSEAESSTAKLPQGGSARRGGGRAAGGALSVANVGTQFKDNLNELMTSIRQTKVHYVRCIKPNQKKSPHEMDQPMVVAQLRCAGVIEAIRISRVAYPNRHLLEELLDKFWVFDKHRKTDVPLVDRCQTVMEKMSFSTPTQYQIGRTRIYFRYGVLEEMEERKAMILDAEARRVQHLMRGFCERLKYLRKLQAIIKLQFFRHDGVDTKAALSRYAKQFMEKRKNVVKTQAFIRMKIQRQKYKLMLTDKKVQDNIASQLQDLQSRLHDEQRRNAELKLERDSNHRDSLLFNETNGARSRGKSTAHLWMADADDIIGQLNGEATRLRKKNDEQRARNTLLKNEIEKLKNEKEVIAANYHVKIRQFEDLIREKDKKLAAVEQEVAKLRQRTEVNGKWTSKVNFPHLGLKERLG
uniref:Myosin motor domain-containing protein n=1 Tax=Globisporangium ultimum (strain ATCC 200006 / CBS 805.95 / DAOM BR144) TaxID=431595 RepID=K3X4E7_GLOUD